MTSEQALVEAAQADKTQFIALYDKHIDQIYKYLLSRTSDPQLAQDLSSETFIRALENLPKYKWTGKPFSAWLYRIAINEMNKHYRKNKSELKALQQSWHENDQTSNAADREFKEEEAHADESQILAQLNEALHQLKAKEQDVLSLRYFEELSYEEIADSLNITVSNVGVRINRALKKLNQLCNFPLHEA